MNNHEKEYEKLMLIKIAFWIIILSSAPLFLMVIFGLN